MVLNNGEGVSPTFSVLPDAKLRNSQRTMSSPIKLTFAELKARDPPFNTWGLYGEDNELGRLNLITPEAVQRGLAAAKHGIRVNLK